mmetsp:Transcript_45921/g.127577  ORF Transcript_45921/g.127577 Transcript_45921/m.127577 type:complete len:258 (-) Transcript_45921:540-1313(-)
MAWRCRATPTPERYLDSASASAALTWMIFSASAFSFAAERNRFWALISFMAALTCTRSPGESTSQTTTATAARPARVDERRAYVIHNTRAIHALAWCACVCVVSDRFPSSRAGREGRGRVQRPAKLQLHRGAREQGGRANQPATRAEYGGASGRGAGGAAERQRGAEGLGVSGETETGRVRFGLVRRLGGPRDGRTLARRMSNGHLSLPFHTLPQYPTVLNSIIRYPSRHLLQHVPYSLARGPLRGPLRSNSRNRSW